MVATLGGGLVLLTSLVRIPPSVPCGVATNQLPPCANDVCRALPYSRRTWVKVSPLRRPLAVVTLGRQTWRPDEKPTNRPWKKYAVTAGQCNAPSIVQLPGSSTTPLVVGGPRTLVSFASAVDSVRPKWIAPIPSAATVRVRGAVGVEPLAALGQTSPMLIPATTTTRKEAKYTGPIIAGHPETHNGVT
jgi:hypothetical protein